MVLKKEHSAVIPLLNGTCAGTVNAGEQVPTSHGFSVSEIVLDSLKRCADELFICFAPGLYGSWIFCLL
jgi:hypothetical protein